MRNLRIFGTKLNSAAPAETEEVTNRAACRRVMNGYSAVPKSKTVKCLAVRYLEVQRLREQVLEAESKKNFR